LTLIEVDYIYATALGSCWSSQINIKQY